MKKQRSKARHRKKKEVSEKIIIALIGLAGLIIKELIDLIEKLLK
jgi:hypothetical protein